MIVADALAATSAVVTEKVAEVEPAATVTLAGTDAAARLEDRATAAPPDGAAAVSVTVPVAALQRGQQGTFIWVINAGGKAEARQVTVGQIGNGMAVVESGVGDGETVVTSGHYRLQAGVSVAITAEAAAK